MFPDFSTFDWPSWVRSDAAKMWLAGFIVGALVRLFRAALRWFKRAGVESHD